MASYRLGNTAASSLLRSAQSSLTSKQSYDDSIAAYNYQLSGQTDQAWSDYQKYLSGRLSNSTDPVKSLALQKTVDSARKQYQSATITRINTQINYGNMSLSDKRNALVQLHDQAVSIGDNDNAQSLENQYTSVDKQIQAEEAAKASAAAGSKGASSGYDTDLGRGIGKLADQASDAERQIRMEFGKGQLSAKEYAIGLSQINVGRDQVWQQFHNSPDGSFTQGDVDKLLSKEDSFMNNADTKKYNSQTLTDIADNKVGFAVRETKTGDGQFARELVPLKPIGMDANGEPTFRTGHVSDTGDEGNSSFIRTVKGPNGQLESVISKKYKDDTQAGKDGKPMEYVVDKQGKRYLAKDTSSSLTGKTTLTSKNPEDIKFWQSGAKIQGQSDLQTKLDASGYGEAANFVNGFGKAVGDKVTEGGKAIGKALGSAPSTATGGMGALAGNAFDLVNWATGNKAKVDAAKQAAVDAQARQEREKAAITASQMQRVGAIPAPPKPATVKTPTFVPTPGNPAYVNNVTRSQQVMQNPKSTPFQAIEALRGGLNVGGF